MHLKGFPGDANAGDIGDPGSTSGLERSPEEGMATHSSILPWKIPWLRSLANYRGCKELERLTLSLLLLPRASILFFPILSSPLWAHCGSDYSGLMTATCLTYWHSRWYFSFTATLEGIWDECRSPENDCLLVGSGVQEFREHGGGGS